MRRFLWTVALSATLGCGGGDDTPSPATPNGSTPTAAAPSAPPAQTQVCTGEAFTCVSKTSGEVYCAGRNTDSQLGDGTAQTRDRWVPVQGVSGARQLACGTAHACALTATGVFCWGANASGELGAGNTDIAHAAVQVVGLTDATQLALGDSFSCARKADGHVSCWGKGEHGRLGNGHDENSATPVDVSGVSDAVQVAAGRAHACARKTDGTVVCWGMGTSGQLGQGTPNPRSSQTPVPVQGVTGATQVAAGGNHSCALVGAEVKCWGQNNYGQSGGSERNTVAATAIAGLTGATQLALGQSRTCALVAQGGAMCWGYNNYVGELLGVGSQAEKVETPTAVAGVTGLQRMDTFGGSTTGSACGVDAQNQLWCWGTGSEGRFGNGERDALHNAAAVLPNIEALEATASVAPSFPAGEASVPARTGFDVGPHVTCGVRDGKVFCFGPGNSGALGHGATRPNAAADALPVEGITDAADVAVGLGRACALRRNGDVACWGQLTQTLASSSPVPIEGVHGATAMDVGGSAATMTVCVAHGEDGQVQCVGGHLGANHPVDLEPTTIEGVDHVTALNVGTSSACALKSDGHVYCWGSDSYGELGNGDEGRSAAAVEVGGVRDAVALGGGGYNHCALRRNHSVVCWGSGDDGQLTNGHTGREANSQTPVPIRGLRDVASLSKMGDSMCAALSNGDAMCWGANDFGQTGHGDSDTDDVTTPWSWDRSAAPVAALGGVVEIGCGWNYCCALHEHGVSCAGSTPLRGSRGFLGMSNLRTTTPVVAPSLSYTVVANAE